MFQTPDVAHNFLFGFLCGIPSDKRIPDRYKESTRSTQLDGHLDDPSLNDREDAEQRQKWRASRMAYDANDPDQKGNYNRNLDVVGKPGYHSADVVILYHAHGIHKWTDYERLTWSNLVTDFWIIHESV